MTLAEFKSAVHADVPPAVPLPLVALWHDARGDWNAAHEAAQRVDDAAGSWVHAYLHRKEGDESNAAYWYRRAGQPMSRGPLGEEWERIATALLGLSQG